MDVKMPVLLDSSLKETAILYPTKGSLRLEAQGVSECQLTLGDKSQAIPMHGWVKIFNRNGLVGIYRRTSRSNNIAVDKTVTLRHGIDILQDSVWEGSEDFDGAMPEFITAILNHQTSLINGVRPWVLGTCEKTDSVSKSLNYDNLLDLLQGTVDDGEDYYFIYDQTVWPWRVNLVAKPSGVRSEFRLNRNIERCKISDNDSEICTRLILNVNKTDKNTDPDTPDELKSIYRVYNNTAAQASYGIIVKTADIDVTQDTLPGGPFPEADAWAADFLAKRAAPQLQIQIDGLVLSGITGDTWDESRLAEQCRVALPEYGEAIEQRVVTIQYPDLYGTPQRITVSLANVLPSYSQSIKSISKETTAIAKETRTYNRQEDSLNKYFAIYNRQGEVLKQAGMKLDANGFLVYADDGPNKIGAKFEVQAGKIGMVVGTGASGNYIKAGEIALAINDADESVAHIDANHVNISATDTLHSLAGAIEEDDQGNVTIKSAGGMRVRKTVSGQVAEFGVFDENSLTAGVIVDLVNGGSVTIKGSKVWVGDAATDQTLKKWATESDGLFAQNIGALSARIGTIEADYVTADEIDANYITTRLAQASSVSVALLNTSGAAIFGGGTYATNGLWVEGTRLTIGNGNFVQSVVGSSTAGGGYKFTVTQADGSSVDYPFNVASSITFSGAWAGASYTATAKDPDDNVLGSVTTAISKRWNGSDLLVESGNDTLLTESMSAHVGTGNLTTGGLRTIDTFNSSHKAYGYVIGNSMSYPLFTFNVDASGEYTAGRTAGAASVTVSAAGWQGGSNVVSASNGESVTVSMPAVTMSSGSWSSHKKTVYAYSSEAGISGYIASHEVDATTEYSSGVTAGNTAAGVTSSWSGNTFTVTRAANTSTKSLSCIVTITPNSAKTLGYGESVTVKALGNASEKASVVITAPADRYQTGYNAGWAAARAKISRSGNKIMVPPATVDGAAVEGYAVTVIQGSISATRVTSSNYALSASASAYISGTAVATDSTSRGLQVG